MLSYAYANGGCVLGAIFGTGTNGAFAVPIKDILKLGRTTSSGTMILNTEWGGFDNARAILPSTPFDLKVDNESINPGYQAFEKFISGMYLGEISRNIMISLIHSVPPLLFNGCSSPSLERHYGFDSAYMSAIESAKDLQAVKEVLVSTLGFSASDVSVEDAATARFICELVATRAASLSACAVAAVLVHTGRVHLESGEAVGEIPYKIGVDGSIAEHYPFFEKRLRAALRDVLGKHLETNVEIGVARDGSGVGAALGALQTLKQNRL